MILRAVFFFQANNNLHNESALLYILDAIEFRVFSKDLYPSVIEKAAALCWNIIKRHVFHDGNKRTGIMCAIIFAEQNGLAFLIDEEIVPVTILIAENKIDFREFVIWFSTKIFRVDKG